ncbi:aminopeptidase [Fulvivirga ligni]|uniref:aminopeptidase n=1 Tax=Fulvivirga ligni TaxID=2904246 RepID=UPI001F3DA0BA|nr:aminopeptidase [Fulvivirga ligni]UII21242.1 aminopeptidase [Fulvivirga ligni]
MIKKIGLILIAVLLIWVLFNLELVGYAYKQAKGQLHIVWNARPVSEYIADPEVADSVKQKLHFIAKVRQYAIDSLGLNNTDNYTTMYDQKGKPILWVVTGCEPYELKAKEWDFPIVGQMPYKGFFMEEDAKEAMEELSEEGYDAGIRTVGGWSTLGWFKDPILSNMLYRNTGDLANLIIHELVHATIFVKDSVEFNENIASFIAERGAYRFLKDTYGEESEEYLTYKYEIEDENAYIGHVLRGADSLEKLYAGMANKDDAEKSQEKQLMIRNIVSKLDTISFHFETYKKDRSEFNPNNTYFMSFLRYRSKQDKLMDLFENKFNEDLTSFITYFEEKHPFL